MAEEIIIKGTDGKWYVLKGEELFPYEEKAAKVAKATEAPKDLPKGVSGEEHERLEKTEDRRQKTETLPVARPLSSVVSPPVSHEGHPLQKELEELVDQVVKNVELRMQNVEWMKDLLLQKRFRTIVSARLRDVRDVAETHAVLIRSQKVGGLGIDAVSSATVLTLIERAFQEFQKKWKEVEAKRIEEWKKKQAEDAVRKEEERKKKEEQELEERYRKLTGEKGRSAGDTDSLRLRGSSAPSSPRSDSSPVAAAKGNGGSLSSPLGQSRTTILARSTPSTPPEQKVGKEDKKQALLPPATVKPLPLPIPPKPYPLVPSPSSKITDVRPVPRLTGPLEELRSITLQDFRRLAAIAPEAALKISAKIDFLAQESLARRSAAVEAWRASPLNQLYTQMLQRAISERTSPELVLEKEKAIQAAALTKEEFYAIMEMNQKLRF